MKDIKTPTDSNSISNTPNNPEPTAEQIKQIYKSRKSQQDQALEILKRDGSISSAQMLQMGWHSGPKRISEIKEKGYIIEGKPDWNKNGSKTYYLHGKQDSKILGGCGNE